MKSFRFISSFSIIALTLLPARVSAQPLPVPVKFSSTVPYDSGVHAATSVAIGDLIGDGKPDLDVAGRCTIGAGADCPGQQSLLTVLMGNGDATFRAGGTYPSGGSYVSSEVIEDPLGSDKRCGTQTTLSSSGSPSLITDDVTFTAQAIANDVCRRGEQITCDDGGVAFYDGSTLIGNIALKNCLAVFNTASLTVGRHLITARFNPPSDWHQSYARVSQIVEKQPTSTTLTASPNPSLHGQEVVFTATAFSPLGLASGNVRFAVAGNSIAIVPVDWEGIATIAKKNLPVGMTSITAEYLGDPDNGPSTSAPLNQVVNPN